LKLGQGFGYCYAHTYTHTRARFENVNGPEKNSHSCTAHCQKMSAFEMNGKQFHQVEGFRTGP